MSPRLQGYLLALAAPLCWSVGGVVFRTVEAGPWDAVFWRSLGHVIAFPALFLVFGRALVSDARQVPATGLLVALCVAATFVLHVLAMMTTTVANVLVLQSLAPVLVATLAWPVLGERVSARGWTTIAVAFAGLILVIGNSMGSGRLSGDMLAIGVALANTVLVLVVRRTQHLNMQPVTWLGAAISTAMALPLAAPFALSGHDAGLLLVLGIIQNTIGLTCYLAALRLLPAAQVVLVALLESVLGASWTWLFVGEEPASHTILGGSMIVSALAANAILVRRPPTGRAAQPA